MMKLRLSEGEGLALDLIAQKWLPRGDRNSSSQTLKSSEAREIQKVKESVNRSIVSDFATPLTVARQAPLSMGFSRQEFWSG